MSSYNFCPQCGEKLMPDARFCSGCGTPLDAFEVDLGAGAGGEGPQRATSSFAAAVESTRSRSRRKMPLVVLVALALALTSAVAFAAYQVYTQVIAPAMQEQQASAPGQVSEEGKAAEARAEAEAAYQAVIDDYKAAISEYAQAGSSYDQSAFTAKHPYVYGDRLIDESTLDASKCELSYSFTNFREDETPVLLVRAIRRTSSLKSGYSDIAAAYVLVNGEPTVVAESGHDAASLILVNDKILHRVSLGTDQSGTGTQNELYFDISSQDGNVSQEAASIGTNLSYITTNGVMILTKEPSYIHVIGSLAYPRTTDSKTTTVTHPDGSVTTSEGDSSGAIESLEEECLSTRAEALELDWQPLS